MFGKKSDLSKKDMNFFSEFSSSGAQTASMLTLALIFFVIVLVLAVGFWLIVLFRTNAIQSDIDDIREEINDPENQALLLDFDRLSLTLENKREYLYVLTDLKAQLEQNRFADTENMDTIEECIPDDVVMTDIYYADGTIQIGGTSENYDGALNFAAQLQENDLFTYVHIGEIFYEDPAQELPPDLAIDVWRYHFTFTGTLEAYYQVTITRYFDGTPQMLLSIPVVREYAAGSSYLFDDIAAYSAEGIDYVLNRIVINGENVTPEEFEIMLKDDLITGITLETTDIRLMYINADDTQPEGGEEE